MSKHTTQASRQLPQAETGSLFFFSGPWGTFSSCPPDLATQFPTPGKTGKQVFPLLGLVGNPVVQSKGPLVHNAALSYWAQEKKRLGEYAPAHTLNSAHYARFCIQEKNFPRFMQAVRQKPLAGLSVTMPYKEKIIPYLDHLTPLAAAVGAVNTLFWHRQNPADSWKLWGHNTDVEGFIQPLLSYPHHAFPHVVLLGAGGAAKAALYGLVRLIELGYGIHSIYILNRNEQKAQNLAQTATQWLLALPAGHTCTVTAKPWETLEKENFLQYTGISLLIDATPQHMENTYNSQVKLPFSSLFFPRETARPAPLAYAMLYRQTPLLAAAKQAGWSTLDGTAMFMAQANAQFFLWTGLPFPTGLLV